MVERKICKIIDRDPNLIKMLNQMPEPYKRHTVVKHWGFKIEDNDGVMCDFIPANWIDLQPNIIN